MKDLLILCCLISVAAVVNSEQEVCYDDYGCFNLDYPWWSLKRPFAVLPESPGKVQTRFLLYTRTANEEVELMINKTGMLQMSDFKNTNPTKFIIHGAMGSSYEDAIQKLKNALLQTEAANVIVVDWRPGAEMPYMQAVANARLVGVQLAQMIRFLKQNGMSLDKLHLIGHDIGAHASGYAGKAVYGIGRITGLDPNEPYFGGSDRAIRLDVSDATFVDVVHTDGTSGLTLGFGMDEAIGHVDFYPNGGHDQPGCGGTIDKILGIIWNAITMDKIGIKQALGCSHIRAIELFTDSITTSCPYLSIPCNDWDAYQTGKCVKSCSSGQCTQFGFYSDKSTARGKMYLTTNNQTPFCRYSEFVTLTTADHQESTFGYLSAKVIGKSGKTELTKFQTKGTIHIEASKEYTALVDARLDIGDIKEVQIEYKNANFLFKPKLALTNAVVRTYDNKLKSKDFHACDGNVTFDSGSSKTLPVGTSC